MANKIPLIINAGTGQIQELPSGDNLLLTNNDILGVGSITAANGIAAGGNVNATYFVGNGAFLTGLVVTGNGTAISNGTSNVNIPSIGSNITFGVNGISNVVVVSTDTVTVKGNILPIANVTYDLGSPTQRFNDLYLSGTTIDLGGATISANATALVITNPAGGTFTTQGAGAATTYGNANVAANLAAFANNSISTSGNITGGFFIGNGSQLTSINAVTVDITDTNGLTTVYYPTFVENRTTAQIARADVNLTYRTDDNLLTVGNVSVTGNISGGNLTVGSGTITGGNVNGANFNGNVAFGAGTVGGSGNITGGNLSITGNITGTASFSGSISINNAPGGIEGAEMQWALPSVANTSLSGSLIQDVYTNGMRFFESSGNTRGLYMDLGNAPNGSGTAVGYREVPQISFTGNTTIAATDAGRHFYSVSASNLQLTIANNTSVAWTVGTAMTIVNRGTANVLIVPGTGVSLYLAGNSTSANRVVTTYGMATMINVAANIWMINGTVV